MVQMQLPAWDDDPLSSFFRDAEFNNRASSINFSSMYALLKRVHAVFQFVQAAMEKDNREELVVPRFLMIRAWSSFLAAVRLSMSGQLSEASVVLRVAIEQGWYALHIAKDPRPPERSKVWLRRNEDEAAKKSCKKEFTVANVRATHRSLDSAGAKVMGQLYERTIDFGAHPNQMGLFISMRRAEQPLTYKVGILHPEAFAIVATVKMAVEVAIGTLKVFQLIFPQRFQIMSIDLKIEEIIRELQSVFEPYAPKP